VGALQKYFTRASEPNGPRGPREKRVADDRFQLADLLGERRLRQVEPLGGTSEMEFLRDRHEVAKVP